VRILFLHETCGYRGGVEQNVADTADGLTARGHACLLAYGVGVGRDAEAFRARFAGTAACEDLCAAAPPPEAAPLATLVARERPDVLYLHKVPSVVGCLPWLGRLPVLRMIHDHDLCCPRRHKYFAVTGRICHYGAGWRCWLDLAFLRRDRSALGGVGVVDLFGHRAELRRHAALDALLVGSRFMREELIVNGIPPARVHIVPPVVRMAPPQASPPAAGHRILYVGQLIRGKGVDLLLRALARLPLPVAADIAGTGNGLPALETQAARLGLADRVRFHGWTSRDDLEALYRGATVVAVPSRWAEPFGMIGLEAMQHGRPVVAFAVGGIPDWLEDGVTGLLVPEADVGGFARALGRVLTEPGLAARLGAQARARVAARFVFAEYLDRLEGLLRGASPRGRTERPGGGSPDGDASR
jgi:glycosyltransferase involved in cell wall biosynthesis